MCIKVSNYSISVIFEGIKKPTRLKDITIQKSDKTPLIKCDFESKTITIEGISIPEDSITFFSSAVDWVEQMCKDGQELNMIVHLLYFNTSTSHVLSNLFRQAEMHKKNGNNVNVIWKFEKEDLDMEDAGLDFAHICPDLNIQHIAV